MEMASTPVSAALPEEKARKMRNTVRPWVATTCSRGGAPCSSDPGASPAITLNRPTTIIVPMARMKK